MKNPACRPSVETLRKATREFTELHEGLSPNSFQCEFYQPPVFPIRRLGRVVQIDYDKRTPDGSQWYYHPIILQSQPLLGFDRRGVPVVYAGKIHVTTRGIEDVPARQQQREHMPSRPKVLSVFGRLRQIRYQPGNAQHVETWKPTRSLDLAHDERGELHILNAAPGENTMAHRRSHRKHHRGSHRRRNPIEFTGDKEKRSFLRPIVPTVAVGVGAAIAAGVADALLSKPDPMTGLPKLSGYKRAGAEAAAGLGLAIISHAVKLPPVVTLAVGVGPVAVGSKTAYDTFRASQAQHQLMGGTQTPNTLQTPATGMAALMPGGLPAAYYGVNRATCGVR